MLTWGWLDRCALLAATSLAGCATQPPAADIPGGRAPPLPAALAAPAPGSELVIAAMTFLDRPYQAGGQAAATGFDCSGFTRYVFGQALGIELPRSAEGQAQAPMLRPVSSRGALQAGDLVFFNTLQRTFSHVGIYLGDGRFIHAPRTGAQVRIESIDLAYWSRRYTGARRLSEGGASP